MKSLFTAEDKQKKMQLIQILATGVSSSIPFHDFSSVTSCVLGSTGGMMSHTGALKLLPSSV